MKELILKKVSVCKCNDKKHFLSELADLMIYKWHNILAIYVFSS